MWTPCPSERDDNVPFSFASRMAAALLPHFVCMDSERPSPAAAATAAEPAPTRRRRWIALALAAVVVIGGSVGYRLVLGRSTTPQYRTAPVERGPLRAVVSATGNLNAVIMVLVGSQVSGTIKELDADFNTVVRRGQVIARIDPALFEAAVNQARADLHAAQATVRNQQAQVQQAHSNVANARAAAAEARAQTAKALVAVVDTRRTRARQAELFDRGLVAEADRDTAQAAYDAGVAQYESAQAHKQASREAIESAEAQVSVEEAELDTGREQVKQKDAALAQAQINLDHTTIRSPVDGVVVNRAVDVGQTVAAALQAPTLFTIAQDLTKMQVETSVDEADIGRIHRNTPVTFTVDAFPGQTFAGEISQIRKAPQVVQNVVTYTVVVAVANPSGRLLPGMTATVKFVTAERENVLKVSNMALRFRPPGVEAGPPEPSATASRGRPATTGRVWTVGRNGRPASVAVTIGITDGVSTEITGGDLSIGQEMLIGLQSGPAPAPSSGALPGPRL
jgi:HlyD family secretion protein